MDFYTNELSALKKSKILRRRRIYCEFGAESCADFASNDYLGLSNCINLAKKAFALATNPKFSAPRASMLVNGYSKLHQKLERKLANLNGFESCILVGSGFLANIALIESLVRKGDKIFIDEEYHASGILASKLVQNVVFFKHNDCVDLEAKIRACGNSSLDKHSANFGIFGASQTASLVSAPKIPKSNESHTENPSVVLNTDSSESNKQSKRLRCCFGLFSRETSEIGLECPSSEVLRENNPNEYPRPNCDNAQETTRNRIIIAIEGIYSMSGDIAHKEFAQIAQKYNAILIVDEAHSSGTLGKNLLGYFDYHHIKIAPNFIKLGTFSKAYGSYGAYILSSAHIQSYLQTRAKPIIYSTALSAFDTALALTNLNFIHKNRARFAKKIAKIKKIIQKNLKIKLDSQIFSIQFQSQNEMLRTFHFLKKRGILVGAIRKPSVKIPQLRIILSTKHKERDIIALCKLLKR